MAGQKSLISPQCHLCSFRVVQFAMNYHWKSTQKGKLLGICQHISNPRSWIFLGKAIDSPKVQKHIGRQEKILECIYTIAYNLLKQKNQVKQGKGGFFFIAEAAGLAARKDASWLTWSGIQNYQTLGKNRICLFFFFWSSCPLSCKHSLKIKYCLALCRKRTGRIEGGVKRGISLESLCSHKQAKSNPPLIAVDSYLTLTRCCPLVEKIPVHRILAMNQLN